MVAFAIMTAVMAVVFVSSWMLRKGKTGKVYRLYTVLIVFSCCLTVSQCVGSLTHSDNLRYERWNQDMKEMDMVDDEGQEPEDEGMPSDNFE